MNTIEATEIVLDLAAQQWGLVTTAQAGIEGVTPILLGRLVEKAVLSRIRSGVYVVASTPWSPATEIQAQWLALEPKIMAADRLKKPLSAVVSHESAAELHGIGDLNTHGVHFTVSSRRQTRQPDVIFHRGTLEDGWVVLNGLPITTPLRTMTDLARAGHEPDHLLDILANILGSHLATRSEAIETVIGIADIFHIHPGGKAEVTSWIDEKFPLPTNPEEMVSRQQLDESLEPMRKIILALISSVSPELKHLELDKTALQKSGLMDAISAVPTAAFSGDKIKDFARNFTQTWDISAEIDPDWVKSTDLNRYSPPSQGDKLIDHKADKKNPS